MGRGGASITETPPPDNDTFTNALPVIDASAARLTGYLVSASREPAEPGFPYSTNGSVWYRWKAPTFGTVNLNFETAVSPLAVYSGPDLEHLELVAQAENGSLSFFGMAGTEYFIAVYQGQDASGDGTFSLHLTAPQLRFADLASLQNYRQGNSLVLDTLLGQTALLLHRDGDSWTLIEAQPIFNTRATFHLPAQISPSDSYRAITIDEALPDPRPRAVQGATGIELRLQGIPGQIYHVSSTEDFIHWSPPREINFEAASELIEQVNQNPGAKKFFRITK